MANRLSFWTLGTPDWDNRQVVDAAVRYGFDGVDLRCAAGRNVSLQSSEEEVRDLKRLFADNGIEISSLLAYNERGNAEGVDWQAVTDDILAHMDLASRLGTANLRVNAASPAKDSTWDAYLDGFAGVLTKVIAESDGVVMNMQNHPGAPNADQMLRLCEMVASPRFGIGLSPDHCVDMGEDPVEVTRRVASHARQLHLADRTHNGPGASGKLRACLPGTGFVPNSEVIDILARNGYEGWVSFKWEKPTYPDLPDADVALPAFIAWIKGRAGAK
jgi:sugar phosphate isomerase/epimerase